MLEKLQLKNFQAHKNLRISFDPGVNCIVGDTDVGKSAIIRALSVLMRNTPSGTDFIRNGAKECAIAISIDGNIIRRIKGKNNLYKLNSDEFASFRNNIPDSIQNVLNINDLNFQFQFDSPFWFALSAGEVSKQLNKLVDLEIIDKTIYNLNSNRRKNKDELDFISGRIKEAKTNIDNLKIYRTINKKLKVLEATEKSLENSRKINGNLNTILSTIKQKQSIIDSFTGVLECKKAIYKEAVELNELREDIDCLKAYICKIYLYKSKTEKKIPNISKLDNMVKRIKEIKLKQEELRQLLLKIKQSNKDIAGIKLEIQQYQKIIKKEFGEVCPLCQKPM